MGSFGVVVRATDFPETVVRLKSGASTRVAVEPAGGCEDVKGTGVVNTVLLHSL